ILSLNSSLLENQDKEIRKRTGLKGAAPCVDEWLSLNAYCSVLEKMITGPTGPIDLPGPKGNREDVGLPRPPGVENAISPSGPKGPKGDVGIPGRPGLDGRDGVPGRAGTDGIPGKDALPGRDVKVGLNGKYGRGGAPGSKGSQGPSGERGIKG
ncbi:hypothetical protein DOY81_013098, partial [Sarcophaga bullata]